MVVTLTSIPPRFPFLRQTLQSLLSQSVDPERIILYFPNHYKRFGQLRKKLDQFGIEYRPIVAGNFTKNPVCKLLDFEVRGELRSANWLHENGLFLGNEGRDLRKQLDLLDFL